jgi:hypothetical protein
LKGELVLTDVVAAFEDYPLQDGDLLLRGFVIGAFPWRGGSGMPVTLRVFD